MDLVDVEGAPHMAALTRLLLQSLGEALFGTLFYPLRICESPALFPVGSPYLHRDRQSIRQGLVCPVRLPSCTYTQVVPAVIHRLPHSLSMFGRLLT